MIDETDSTQVSSIAPMTDDRWQRLQAMLARAQTLYPTRWETLHWPIGADFAALVAEVARLRAMERRGW